MVQETSITDHQRLADKESKACVLPSRGTPLHQTQDYLGIAGDPTTPLLGERVLPDVLAEQRQISLDGTCDGSCASILHVSSHRWKQDYSFH